MASAYKAIVECHILTGIFLVQRFICDVMKSKLIHPNCKSETLMLLMEAVTESVVAAMLVATVANLYVRRRLHGFDLSLWSDRAIFGNLVARCLCLRDEPATVPGKRGIYLVNRLLLSSFSGVSKMGELYWVHSLVATFLGVFIIYGRDTIPKVAPIPESTRRPNRCKRFIRFMFICCSMLCFGVCARILLDVVDGYLKTHDVADGVIYFGIYGSLCAEILAILWAVWISNSSQAKYKGSVGLMFATVLSFILLQLVGDGTAAPMLKLILVFSGYTVNGAISLLREVWSLHLPMSQTIGMVILVIDPFGSFGIWVTQTWLPTYPNARNFLFAVILMVAVCGMCMPDAEARPQDQRRVPE